LRAQIIDTFEEIKGRSKDKDISYNNTMSAKPNKAGDSFELVVLRSEKVGPRYERTSVDPLGCALHGRKARVFLQLHLLNNSTIQQGGSLNFF
jgi:hypothetical protein